MAGPPSRLNDALLELGLEDLIPLPEIPGAPEIRKAFEGEPAIEQVASALVGLLNQGLIQVWRGHWADEPTHVETGAASGLLRDLRRYSFDSEANGLDRVYFVNVENIRA
jgi:hypothetical protein